MAAFKLSKETKEEKVIRKEVIEAATYKAIDVPIMIAKLSYRGLELIDYFLEYGNKNAITDLGVSSLLLTAALEGAILNVLVNLPGINDDEYVKNNKLECRRLAKKGLEIKSRIMNVVMSNL